MLLMIEKEIRGGIYHAVTKYAKVNNKHIKHCNEYKESWYLIYWNVNNLQDGKCLRNYLQTVFDF